MKNKKLVRVEEFFAGTAHFDKEFYEPNGNSGFILKDGIMKRLNAQSEFRWNTEEKKSMKNIKLFPVLDIRRNKKIICENSIFKWNEVT